MTLARTVIRWTPFTRDAVAFCAHLPPRMKGSRVMRVMEAFRRYGGAPQRVTTNFGIAPNYRITVEGSAEGTLLFGRPEDYAGERGCLELAAWLGRDCDAFLDIGAYRGYYTFYLRHSLPNSIPIHWFEPTTRLYQALDRNVNENRLPNVHGHGVALGAKDGQATFYVNLDDPTSSSLGDWFAQKHRVEPVTVPVTTFSSFVRAHGFSSCCVKVDVENAEFAFLEGALPELHRIRYLVMEVLGPAHDAGFIASMIEHGFHAYYINDRRLEHSPAGEFTYTPPQYNWLFCREEPTALTRRLSGSTLSVR
jgi:FkbM family methyltransferase